MKNNIRDGFMANYKYRLKNENKENIINYLQKIDGNKYICKNLIQTSYIDFLIEKLSKIENISRIDIYKKYTPKNYKKYVKNGLTEKE